MDRSTADDRNLFLRCFYWNASPLTKGNIRKGFFAWVFSTHITLIILILVIVGVLGDFVKTQIFPIYAAASVAEMGIIKRVDALFFAVWTTCLFVKISLGLHLFSLCVKKILGEKAARISILLERRLFLLIAFGMCLMRKASSISTG